MSDARKAAVSALVRVDFDGAYSNIVYDSIMKNSRLTERDKALSGALFFGVLDRRITLDYIIARHCSVKLKKLAPIVLESLRIGVLQLLFMEKIPASAAVNESVNIVRHSGCSRSAGLVNAVLHAVIRDGARLPEDDSLASLSVRTGCPEWMLSALSRDYGGDSAVKIAKSFLEPPKTYLRVNTLKTTVAELSESLARHGAETEAVEGFDSLRLLGGADVSSLPEYSEGKFFVQELASQRCAETVGAAPGDRVLDVCAAPGGKSFSMAVMMKNRGEITACDLHGHRTELIKSGAERLGLSCIKALVRDASVFDESLSEFDRVLCDVPCSGLGVIGRKPDIKRKTAEQAACLPEIQRRILENASRYVRPGGRLVYSTCTLLKAENDSVIDGFLSEHADFEPDSIADGQYKLTMLPHITGTDGFFVSSVRRVR